MSLNSHEFHFCLSWCCAVFTAHGFAWLKSPLPAHSSHSPPPPTHRDTPPDTPRDTPPDHLLDTWTPRIPWTLTQHSRTLSSQSPHSPLTVSSQSPHGPLTAPDRHPDIPDARETLRTLRTPQTLDMVQWRPSTEKEKVAPLEK